MFDSLSLALGVATVAVVLVTFRIALKHIRPRLIVGFVLVAGGIGGCSFTEGSAIGSGAPSLPSLRDSNNNPLPEAEQKMRIERHQRDYAAWESRLAPPRGLDARLGALFVAIIAGGAVLCAVEIADTINKLI